ncbi:MULTISPECIES: ester cyclase [Rhodococcus]|uniref:ester cyclase n=1 Tax=Rhodococcus TaxID=1827 RepID=UPI0015E0D764|nr:MULTISPECIES: nuclear transport factor 2 family protein [Rhodococcus]WKX00293.1 nuclear transport factor 2 family protein [Rhodococcus aetherivorans]
MTILDTIYERWNEHDIDGVLAHFHDDLVYTDKTLGTTFKGREELAQFMAATFVSLPDLRFELLHTFETDTDCAGQALMIGTFAQDLGAIKATGKKFSVKYAIVGRKVAGKVTELNDYWNYAEFLGE